MVRKLIALSKELQHDLEEKDFDELLVVHTEDFSKKDLMELKSQQKQEEEIEARKWFQTKLMAEVLCLIEKALPFFKMTLISRLH